MLELELLAVAQHHESLIQHIEKQRQILLSWAPKSPWTVTTAMKLRCLLLGRKAMTKLDSILKSRDIILPTKVHLVKAMVFLIVMYG